MPRRPGLELTVLQFSWEGQAWSCEAGRDGRTGFNRWKKGERGAGTESPCWDWRPGSGSGPVVQVLRSAQSADQEPPVWGAVGKEAPFSVDSFGVMIGQL